MTDCYYLSLAVGFGFKNNFEYDDYLTGDQTIFEMSHAST